MEQKQQLLHNFYDYCMPVIVDIKREMTEVDLGPFGMVFFGGKTALHELLLCLYRVHVTWTALENSERTNISPKSTASRPHTGSMMLNIHDLYLS